MKLFKKIFFILIVFFKTETLFSENDLFNVNNIQLEKKDKVSQKSLSDQAISKGFNQLMDKILLKNDMVKISTLNLPTIKKLVAYYQITNIDDKEKTDELVNFSVTFDKEKIHDLFYKKGISYSEISDKELYTLPILIKDSEIFIFNNNFYYEKWNDFYENDLIEFVLPLENIEIIQKINNFRDNLINLDLENLFKEYQNKNLTLIFIEKNKHGNEKIYIKSLIQGKKISKNLNFKYQNLSKNEIDKMIIINLKKELIDLVKSKNLIDIRTPSFLNVKFDINKKNNLVDLNSKIKNIDLIENVFVQKFNKDFMNIRIKYLGKLDKVINQLKKEKINLKLVNDQWIIRIQ